MTKWAHAKLEELLKAVGAELPAAAGDGKLSVTTVKDLDGGPSSTECCCSRHDCAV